MNLHDKPQTFIKRTSFMLNIANLKHSPGRSFMPRACWRSVYAIIFRLFGGLDQAHASPSSVPGSHAYTDLPQTGLSLMSQQFPKIPYLEMIKLDAILAMQPENRKNTAGCHPSKICTPKDSGNAPATGLHQEPKTVAPDQLAQKGTRKNESPVSSAIMSWTASFVNMLLPAMKQSPAWQHLDPIAVLEMAKTIHPEWDTLQINDRNADQRAAVSRSEIKITPSESRAP